MKMKKIILSTALISLCGFAVPATAQIQSTQDISIQLQSSLESQTPVVVYFDFDKDSLTPEASAVLLQQASWLLSKSEAKVDLAGHTDAVGTNEYNYDLAMRRARAVESFLLQNGVRAEQMRSVVSQGENNLAVTTTKRERQNRRVRTSVTGLVEVVVATVQPPVAPTPVVFDPPPPRTYAEDRPPLCSDRSRNSSLLAMTDLTQLQSALDTRMDAAINIYQSSTAINSTGSDYNIAAFTKAECGIAIGFTKKNIADQRSIYNCDCYSSMLSGNTL